MKDLDKLLGCSISPTGGVMGDFRKIKKRNSKSVKKTEKKVRKGQIRY